MPIAPKYTWWETPDEVCIRLEGAPIKDQSQVFCSDAVVKVNAAPYFLLLDLHSEVDEDRSAAALHGGSTVLKLQKRAAGVMWGRLTAQGDKAALQQRREASIQRTHAKADVIRQERLARKQRESKEATERQIAVERRKRAEIEARKAQELQQERSQIEHWQQSLASGGQQQQQLGLAEKGTARAQQLPEGGWRLGAGYPAGEGDESDYEDSVDGNDDDQGAAARDQGVGASSKQQQQQQAGGAASAADHEHYYGRGWRPQKSDAEAADKHSAASPTGSSDDEQSEAEEQSSEQEEDDEAAWQDGPQAEQQGAGSEEQAVVPVRAALAPVKVSFTATESPYLPARETREDEIREYKRKNGPSAQQDSTDVSDRQPAFLKDKGDALYAQHNYRGAINAYSRALELDESLPAIWANRAACHLQLGNHDHCAHDCDNALTLLRPRLEAVEQGTLNDDGGKLRRQVVKVLARRAAARAGAGNMQAAAEDLQGALRYDPTNAALAADLSEVLASTAPADAAILRTRGDTRFKAGDHAGAAQAYTLLLDLPAGPLSASGTDRLAAMANRAACWLPLQRYSDCVADCGAALEAHVAAAAAELAASASVSVGAEGCPEAASGARPSTQPLQAEGGDESCGISCQGLSSAAQGAALDRSASSRRAADSGDGRPEAWLATHATALQGAACDGRLASAARLLARRAAAHSYLKQYDAAAGDYGLARRLYDVLGDGARSEQLGRDLEGVLQLQQQAHAPTQ